MRTLLIVAALAVVGCGGEESAPQAAPLDGTGAACFDAPCADGLDCVDLGPHGGPTCVDLGPCAGPSFVTDTVDRSTGRPVLTPEICSWACASDLDCSRIAGERWRCFGAVCQP